MSHLAVCLYSATVGLQYHLRDAIPTHNQVVFTDVLAAIFIDMEVECRRSSMTCESEFSNGMMEPSRHDSCEAQ